MIRAYLTPGLEAPGYDFRAGMLGAVVSITSLILCLGPQESRVARPATVTFADHVAPIIYKRCTPCHRPGEAAPFSLTTYEEAKKWAPMIEAVTKSGRMPPWKAVAGYGEHRDARIITAEEKELLSRWHKSGTAPGVLSSAPALPKFVTGWQLGEPDLVLEMPESFEIAADGPDTLRSFVLPTNLGKDVTVGAIEFRPGNPSVVHHALVFLDDSGQARKLDASDAGPGYESFGGPGFFPSGSLGGWAPGGSPQWLPDDVGRYLKNGSDVVIQIHYHPNGMKTKDRSRLGIYFSRKPATKLVGGIALENWEISIPPGSSRYHRTASYMLPVAAEFLSVTPHLHLLGKEMKAKATLPDGTVIPLVWVKNWDFLWQDTYYFEKPIELPAGTLLSMDSWHDNSSENPLNPFDPPRTIVYGEGSNDEMSLCIFEVTTSRLDHLLYLIADDSRNRKVLERAIALTKAGKVK